MKRLGASVDWDREYFTMDENLSRAVREVFVRLYEEGLIYRGKYIVNWCPRCGTAISDLEVKHEEIAGKLYEIRYPVVGTNEFITVATTRPETMLGDTAVAVNAKDERYKHLHGKKVLLPLMNREIPIITDDLAQPEFGTGAVKVTPAHDPNDFQAGLRHNLPQIEVMDEHARMNENAGPYAGLDRYEARKRVLEDLRDRDFWSARKTTPSRRQVRSLRNGGRAAAFDAVVHQDRAAGQSRDRGRRERRDHDRSGKLQADLSELDAQHPRLVHLAAVVVGTPDSGVALLVWRNYCRARGAREVHEVRRLRAEAGYGRARHLVLVGLVAVYDSGMAGEDARSGSFLSHYADDHRLRDFVFLGGAHDHVRLPFHAGASAGSEGKAGQRLGRQERRQRSLSPGLYSRAGARCRPAEDVEDQGERDRSARYDQAFGTDATRFTLAAMAAPGTDIAFNESRTEGYREFANKIWNAARFMFMNVDRVEPGLRPAAGSRTNSGVAGIEAVVLEDRWILSRFNRVTKSVNESLETYRFHEAANRIYDFFWGEFCDWYIELIKPRLLDGR